MVGGGWGNSCGLLMGSEGGDAKTLSDCDMLWGDHECPLFSADKLVNDCPMAISLCKEAET